MGLQLLIKQLHIVLIVNCLWLLLTGDLISSTDSDISCLKSLKSSFVDPNNYLKSSWNFDNTTEGFICRFTGVECWHPDENRVLNIKLADMGLKGEFPRGIQNCTSMTGLDLSVNKISGEIPSDISKLIGFITSLDLSSNNFSGQIPANLANCSYLNVLKLDHNRLTGQIPAELGNLNRIKTFSVTNNLLTGPVPTFSAGVTIPAESYATNLGLCGKPLDSCKTPPKKSSTGIIAGAAVGGVTFAALVVGLGMIFYYRKMSKFRKKKNDDPEGNKWAKSLKKTKGVKVSLFEKSVSKMKLKDLMKATNNFHKDNIIGSGRSGTMYRGVLEDGSSLMIKRLQDSQRSEKEFTSEMGILGSVKHKNLVPLLGFCMVGKERLLVYQNMPNGTLYDKLHPATAADGDDSATTNNLMDWSLRLKIGLGAAKGFAWLHHNCNPRIIHRNVSSNCILLDSNFEPKISDFGLARLMNPIDTHLSTFVNGEFGDLGYVAPEYARTLMATPKGDIYSFGVVLLELVTGEKPTNVGRAPETFKGNLVEWVTLLSGEGRLQDAIDKSLAGKGVDNELFQVLKVACNCVVLAHKERPTMFEVYQLLRAIGERYHFSMDDDVMMMPTDTGEADYMEELIVSRETQETN